MPVLIIVLGFDNVGQCLGLATEAQIGCTQGLHAAPCVQLYSCCPAWQLVVSVVAFDNIVIKCYY